MKRSALLVALALLGGALLAGSPPARAVELSLESRTFLPAREDGEGNQHITLYEYLDAGAEDLFSPGFFARAGGWGRADLADETYGESTDAELQYGFVGWRAPRLGAEIRLGRVSVTGGAARNEVLDGAQLRSDLAAGFDILAFGGVPVEVSDGGRSGDLVYGGRLSQGLPGLYRVGLSYLKEEDDDATAREEAAVDLWVQPLAAASLSGSSLYNVDAENFARHDYRLALGPFLSRLTLKANYGWVDYGAFFTSPGTSAFAFPALDPAEKLQSYGGAAEFSVGAGVVLAAEYTAYTYDLLGDAAVYGARLDWSRGPFAAGAAYRRADGDAPELTYDEFRLYCSGSHRGISFAAGLGQVSFDEEINGTTDARSATLAATMPLAKNLTAGADVEYGSNPSFDSEWKGMLRLTYRWASAPQKGGAAK